uniref:CUB domain-containing protein n=1 Tax=Timema genevievae TaxID=629358 RepID=A0A7R9JZN6_TIMGE|nr:unnamed protein product [Timema genevievae]
MTFAGNLVFLAAVCICSCYGSDITLWTSYNISDDAGPGLEDTSSCNRTDNVTSGATLTPSYDDLIGCDTWTRVVTITDGYAIDVIVESMDVGQDDYLTINAGGRRLVDASVPVFTGKIRTPRKIRALTSTAVFIEFVAQPSNDTQYTGFTLTFQKYGEITTSTETSTEASTLPLAPQSVSAEFTVYLSGLTPVVGPQGSKSLPFQDPQESKSLPSQGPQESKSLPSQGPQESKSLPSQGPQESKSLPFQGLQESKSLPSKDRPRAFKRAYHLKAFKRARAYRPRAVQEPSREPTIPGPSREQELPVQGPSREQEPTLKNQLFAQNITEFKNAVKGMAVNFCTANSIDIIDNITEKNVVILYAAQCPITWPNSDTCVQVTMSVPVVVLNDTAYEMTTIHLYQMWNQYSARDALLQELGLKVYSVPRTELTMYTWMGVSLGCLAIFAIILVLVWRLDIFANYSDRLSGVSESQPKMSTTSQKSWIELPYQEFPPMGVDDFPEYEPDNLHTGKGVHINLHPLPSPTPKLPSYGPPQEYGAALHFFPTSFDNQALIEEDDDIDQKHDRNTSTS